MNRETRNKIMNGYNNITVSLKDKILCNIESLNNIVISDSRDEMGSIVGMELLPYIEIWVDWYTVTIDALQTKKTGIEQINLWYTDIDYYFSATPENIPDYYKEKIDAGYMWLAVEFNHDEKTVSWFYEESNNAHTSWQDDYYGAWETIQEIKYKEKVDQFACMMNENPSIPDSAIDEFETHPEATIKKYKEWKKTFDYKGYEISIIRTGPHKNTVLFDNHNDNCVYYNFDHFDCNSSDSDSEIETSVKEWIDEQI